jgi:hypothetical protein
MGYPLEVQALIIEDEPSSKHYYEAVFDSLASGGCPLVTPRYAFCHKDGEAALDTDRIYHLVILDLRLPHCPGEPPAEGVDWGLDLLQRCLSRDSYPVPALLVISAHLDNANQSDLHTRVAAGFSYGRVLIKGVNLEADIRSAVDRAVEYCRVGIHVRDGGVVPFPTISPRDEDLLRRAVLAEGCCNGLDLEWWSAEYDPPFAGDSTFSGWTKTLMGSFLLDNGRGKSRPTFFKLAPNVGAEVVAAEAKLLQHKLSHIKVFQPIIAGNRSLLITQKVGEEDGAPVSLAEYLGRESGVVAPFLPAVIREVTGQLARLGDSSPDHRTVEQLLWPHHDLDRLRAQWDKWRGKHIVERLGAAYDAISVFERLRRCGHSLRVGVQTALHGDLNPTNVALDVRTDGVRGYIFDASGVTAGINFRDLAMLEVTSLLHQPVGAAEDLVTASGPLYGDGEVDVRNPPPPGLSERGQNTWALIAEIRRCALACPEASKLVYAVTVFDHALIQFGGLAFAISRNKLRDPDQAAELVARVAHWLELVSPGLCSDSEVKAPSAAREISGTVG